MKKNIIALSLFTLSICTHSCAMEKEGNKEEHIDNAISTWAGEKSLKKKSKSHIVKRKKSDDRKSKSHIVRGPGSRRQSGSDFVNTVEGMRHSAGEIPAFNQKEKQRTFSFGKSFKGLSGSPLSPRKQPRERAKSATELDLRVLLVPNNNKTPLTPTTPRKKTLLEELEDEEHEKQRRESVERKFSSSGLNAAKMMVVRKAKLRRSNYAGNRKGRDSQTDFSSQQYLGKDALELFDADTTEGSEASPRTDENSSPRNDNGADPFQKSSDEEKNDNNSNNTGDNIKE